MSGRYASRRTTIGVALGLVLGATSAFSADWPAFRGATGDGRCDVAGVIADPESVRLTVRWRRDLGSAYSGIAVAGDRLFTLYSDGSSDHLIALDRGTGKAIWRLRLGPAYRGHDGSHDGPLSTPAVGDDIVVALGARGELVAARCDSGVRLWRLSLVDDLKAHTPHYGFATSPRLAGRTVVLPVGGYQRAIVGLDLASGALRWAAGTDAVAYQSPVILATAENQQVVVSGSSKLFALDPTQGILLWQHEHGGGGTRGAESLSPVAVDGHTLLLTHRDDASQLIRIDGPANSAATAWQSRAIRNSYALPVYHDGFFYAYSARSLVCVDAGTGERRWRSRAPGDGFPILVDGHLVIQTKEGGLFVVRARPESYQERAGLQLFDDHSWTSPSWADGAVYARSFTEIARVDLQAGSEPGTETSSTSLASGPLKRLAAQVKAADDPQSIVDAFLASRSGFPIADGNLVHFVYHGQATDVALAGDLAGARREWPMQRLEGTDLFFRSVKVEPDAVFSYLFMVDFEPVTDPLNPRTALSRVYGAELEPVATGDLLMSWFTMPGFKEPAYLEPATAPRGCIKHHLLHSQALVSEVPIAIYQPPGFRHDKGPYPVVYIFDGRGALEQGELPTALDNLIGTTVQPLLAVFILERGHGGPRSFASMFATELIPFVDAAYPTAAGPEQRAVAGSGWESLTAAYCAFKHPDTVGKLAMQSLYALTAPPGFPHEWVTDAAHHPLQIYLDWGTYDPRNSHEAWSMAEDARRFFEVLRERGYEPVGGEVHQGSGWPSWRTRTHRWLQALFPLTD